MKIYNESAGNSRQASPGSSLFCSMGGAQRYPSMNRVIVCCFIALSLCPFPAAQAACVPPSADRVDTPQPAASKSDLAGHLLNLQQGRALIEEHKTKRRIVVDVSKTDRAYSAFGGDEYLSKLRPGIAVKVWFKGCSKPRKGIPVAAFFELFSNDPTDQPGPWFFTRKGYP